MDKSKPRVDQKPTEKEKLDGYLKSIILEPSHITNKRRNASINIETYKTAEAKK